MRKADHGFKLHALFAELLSPETNADLGFHQLAHSKILQTTGRLAMSLKNELDEPTGFFFPSGAVRPQILYHGDLHVAEQQLAINGPTGT